MTARRVRRRTLALGAAWAVPTAVLSVAAPGYAASRCLQVTMDSTWTWSSSLQPQKSNGLYTIPDGVGRFRSVDDNTRQQDSILTVTGPTLSLAAGTRYTFTFTVTSGFGNNDSTYSRLQAVDLRLGDQTLLRLSTRPRTGYTTLTTIAMSQPARTFQATYTAPASTAAALTYVFTLPPFVQGSGLGTQDDIAVSAPAITCS